MANEYVSKVVLSSGETLIDLTSDTITPSDLAKDVTAHDKSGAPITGTSTKDVDSTDATAAASEILATKTAYARGAKLTGTMPNRGAVNGTLSSKTPYTIPQGYHDGSGKVALDSTSAAAIVPENIREGVEILGITGAMSGSEDMSAQAVTVTPTFTQQTITPDSSQNYNCISQVTVAAISVVYSDNSAGGQTVTIG
jgi:hypothetical protein